jgi:hypothetical protein
MEGLRAVFDELHAGLSRYPSTSGEYKYYEKKINSLKDGLRTLVNDAAINTVELRLYALYYEANALYKDKENDNSARIAEIENEASVLRDGLHARKPRIATSRVFTSFAPSPS